MEIIRDIPLRKVLGRDFSAVTYAMDFFYLVNGKENKVYKCDLNGNFLCSYNTRAPLSSLCYNTEEGCFIGISANLCNRILFYDSAFSRMDVCYLPVKFCSEEQIEFVKYDCQNQQTLFKKGSRWLILTAKTDGGKVSCDVNSSPEAVCNLTAVCCQAILVEKFDVLSGSDADGSYYDLTLPTGYLPLDLCIVETGAQVIVPALIVKTADGSSRLILCRIAKGYGQCSPAGRLSEAKQESNKQLKVTVTHSQLLFSLFEITFTVDEEKTDRNPLPLLKSETATYLKKIEGLLSLDD